MALTYAFVLQIGCVKFKNKTWDKWVSRFSTMPTIMIYTTQIINEFLKCLARARKEKLPL